VKLSNMQGPDGRVQTKRLPALSPEGIEQAIAALNQGEVIAFPTDTVYGVGAHAFQAQAVARLYAIKERPSNVPIPLLLPDVSALDSVCIHVPPLAWRIAERFWPGGLSLVLYRAPVVPGVVTAGRDTLAVRVPQHALVRDMCRRLGAPLAATSANLHGQPAPASADDVMRGLEGRIPLMLDGGLCPGGIASTLLDMTVSPPVLLRSGPITVEQLAAFVPLGSD
jgi:L-threonylcarbamoyladenylate synthase